MLLQSSRAPIAATLIALGAVGLPVSARSLAAQGAGRIHGRVTEEESGRPLDGARVQLRRSTLVTVTDSKGRYVLRAFLRAATRSTWRTSAAGG